MKEKTTGLMRVSKNKHNTNSNQGVVHLLEACIRSITLKYKIITTLEKRVQLRMQIGRLKVTFKLMKIETVITLVRILKNKRTNYLKRETKYTTEHLKCLQVVAVPWHQKQPNYCV